MIFALLSLACAPEIDPCSALREEIEACGFAYDAYACDEGDATNGALFECMANEIAAEECPRRGTIRGDYSTVTIPAYDACAE